MKEIPKAYNPKKVEDKIYAAWEESGFFNPDNLPEENIKKDKSGKEKTYAIVLPPPNITAKLHLGHSMMLAIEDLLIRYHRMKGYRTLWIPGTDHAAIATQNVVEKKLLKEEGLTRHDLGREKFLKKVWEYLEETQAVILSQTRKMGASLDWSREAFTLDEQREKAVKKMFVDMYEAGVIYRGERIVNWCPRCQSTLADDEVEYKEQKAKLYTFKYSRDFPFAVATTRPETKLGDTAVAVNPKDGRYKKHIGKIYEVDFVGIKLKLKIIADRHVETDFGTGALGVTPAHSMADWQMAEENNLEIIKVIGEDGKIKNNFGEYSNKSVEEAREMVVESLRKNNLLEKEEEIENNLSLCYRCGTAIEPLPSKQWFVSVSSKFKVQSSKFKGIKKWQETSLKELASVVAENDQIKFIPERFKKRYLDWMENLHDWCISRQIWFGHRIPVWYRTKSQIQNSKSQINSKFNQEIYVGTEPPKGEGWVQDEDSLDTWFSSGMWTFSTLGWPDNFKNGKKINDLAKFHPTQVLETGYEILTLWVSRMIMMSLFALQEIPFENVYLHGMLLDKRGKKMSKSRGNGIDPIDMIEKYGVDAARLSLLTGMTPGNDIRFFEEKIEGQRNFVNKLWNVSRFILSGHAENKEIKKLDIRKLEIGNLSLADKWILGKLDNLIKEITDDLENYNFSPAGEKLKDFTWGDFADWYIEVSKIEKDKDEILIYILKQVLILWHPFVPFVTEEIWGSLETPPNPPLSGGEHKDILSGVEHKNSFSLLGGEKNLLMIEKWPSRERKFSFPVTTEGDFETIKSIIIAIRNVRSQYKVEPSKKINAVICAGDKKELVESQARLIKGMRTGIDKLEIKEKSDKIKDAVYLVVGVVEIYLLEIIDKEKEKKNLRKEIGEIKKYLKQIKSKIDNKNFIANAPIAVVEKEKNKYNENEKKLKKLEEKLNSLS